MTNRPSDVEALSSSIYEDYNMCKYCDQRKILGPILNPSISDERRSYPFSDLDHDRRTVIGTWYPGYASYEAMLHRGAIRERMRRSYGEEADHVFE